VPRSGNGWSADRAMGDPGGQLGLERSHDRFAAVAMTGLGTAVPDRLRVTVAISDTAGRGQLAALVAQSGHEQVELSASPDAVLTDGTATVAAPTATVALGAPDPELAGLLLLNPSPAQVGAALCAVAAEFTVRAPSGSKRSFRPLPEGPPVLLSPREIEILAALGSDSATRLRPASSASHRIPSNSTSNRYSGNLAPPRGPKPPPKDYGVDF
jgi:hypothetical protein